MKREWYSYLNKTGFKDLEKSEYQLKTYSSSLDNNQEIQNKYVYEAKQNYFMWASTQVYQKDFKSNRDKIMWEFHSEGLTSKEIAPRFGLEDSWVRRNVSKIRKYLKTQPEIDFIIASMSAKASVTRFSHL